MPTTVAGVFLIVAFAFPGYVYEQRRRRSMPERTYSPFEELLAILFVGVLIDIVVVMALVPLALALPWPFPDPGMLIEQPRGYLADHLPTVVVWSLIGLAVATALAYVLGARPWVRLVPTGWRERTSAAARKGLPQQSAWWLLFREHRRAEVYVGCVLDDGSYVAGDLHSYSKVAADHPDRDLTLRGEIYYRAPGAKSGAVLPDVNAAVVSARRLMLLTVTYVLPTQVTEAGGENDGTDADGP